MSPLWRDRQIEERARFEFLLRLYQMTRFDRGRIVHAADIGFDVGLSRVQTFAVVDFLAERGFVEYLSAGPRIRISPHGVRYLDWEADSRQSIR